jgi:HK97 family phage major capsid protein
LGDPQTVVTPSLFGLTVVPTTSITSGTFLVGSGNQAACEIRDRMETIVEISTSHASFFTQNLVAVRCEKRLALVTKRVHSFVTGTFSQSPA